MPAVSVVIPTHNRAGLLAEAIASVRGQTTSDWEIVVVDDGSTDETRQVVAACGDARVRYVYQEHAERSVARNRALSEARGELVAFLDDDDLFLPGKLASEVAYLAAHPEADMVCGGTYVAGPDGAVGAVAKPWLQQPEPDTRNCLLGRCWFQMCSTTLRREALEGLDHWFEPGVSLTEDRDFCLRLVMAGTRVAWLPEVVSVYRQLHPRGLAGLADYSRCYMRMLERLMARADMPPGLRSQRAEIEMRCRFRFAAHAYAYWQRRLAQRELLHALRLAPEAADALHPAWAEALASAATDAWAVPVPEDYYDDVFASLPAPMAGLSGLRAQAWALYCEQYAQRRAAMESWVREAQATVFAARPAQLRGL